MVLSFMGTITTRIVVGIATPTAKRCYKPALDHDKTFRTITEGDGRTARQHFDPQVLTAFADLHRKFEEIFQTT